MASDPKDVEMNDLVDAPEKSKSRPPLSAARARAIGSGRSGALMATNAALFVPRWILGGFFGECIAQVTTKSPIWHFGTALVIIEYFVFVYMSIYGPTHPRNISICGYMELLPDHSEAQTSTSAISTEGDRSVGWVPLRGRRQVAP